MPKMEKGDGEILLKQQFVEGVSAELKKQQPTLSYEKTVAVAQQLDLAGQIFSKQVGRVNQENTSGGTQPATAPSRLVTQLMENMDTLTKKVSELSQSVANINAASTQDSSVW